MAPIVTPNFDINALLAGSAEVYVSENETTPPGIGYPITQSQASTLEAVQGSLVDAVSIKALNGVNLLGAASDPAPAIGTTRLIGAAAAGGFLKELTFKTWTPKPELTAVFEVEGTYTLKTYLEGTDTPASLFIQHFGRVAEFKFSEAKASMTGTGNADGNVLTYTWSIENDSDDNKRKGYTVFTIADGSNFTVQIAQTGGKQAVRGFNSQWALYGDGLISRDAIGYEQTQEVERLRISAVLPAVKLFRIDTSSILTFTCFSVSPEFIARLTENTVRVRSGAAGSHAAYKEVSVSQGSQVEEFAICVRMDDAPTEKGKQTQIIFPNVGITGNVRIPLARTPQGTEVQAESLYSPIIGSNAIIQTQTDEFVWSPS